MGLPPYEVAVFFEITEFTTIFLFLSLSLSLSLALFFSLSLFLFHGTFMVATVIVICIKSVNSG